MLTKYSKELKNNGFSNFILVVGDNNGSGNSITSNNGNKIIHKLRELLIKLETENNEDPYETW